MTYNSSEALVLNLVSNGSHPCFMLMEMDRCQGISCDFTEAVQMAYDGMGVVKNEEQQIIWDRVNRSSARTIQDYQSAAADLTRHLDDMTESQMLCRRCFDTGRQRLYSESDAVFYRSGNPGGLLYAGRELRDPLWL